MRKILKVKDRLSMTQSKGKVNDLLLTDKFRCPHLWVYAEGNWKLRHTVLRNKNMRDK